MYCENCGKNYANVKYTHIINGKKREMFLCEDCSKLLGIQSFNIPMDFSTFLGDFFMGIEDESILPQLLKQEEVKCKRCSLTFEDFINTGKFGCQECYSTFEEKIDPLLRSIQGADRHLGRIGKINEEKVNKKEKFEEVQEKQFIKDTAKLGQINELKRQLKIAIKEERYEEAAGIRDEIKKLEGEN